MNFTPYILQDYISPSPDVIALGTKLLGHTGRPEQRPLKAAIIESVSVGWCKRRWWGAFGHHLTSQHLGNNTWHSLTIALHLLNQTKLHAGVGNRELVKVIQQKTV